MGCYPFSLLAYFNFDLQNFKIRYIVKKKRLIFFEVYFIAKKIKFKIICAVFQKYENFLKVYFKNFTSCKFNYVFYGKKVKKENYYYKLGKKIKTITINEKNIFKKIFSFNKKKFLSHSKTQYFVIKNYLNNLNKIEKVIKL
jgi:hypothetical protein